MKKTWARRLAALLVAVALVAGGSTVQAAKFGEEDYEILANYSQIVYDYTNGLPTNGANDVIQTADGYIWIAGYSGLIRYDGQKFEVFSPQTVEGFASKAVLTLFEDSQNRLWIGTNDKGAMVYTDGRFTPIAAGTLSVQRFTETPEGDILLGAKEGVFRIDNAYAVSTETDTSVQDMLLDAEARLWIIDATGKLHHPELEGLRIDTELKFSSLFCDSNQNIYLSCQEGSAEGDILFLEKAGSTYNATTIVTGMYRIHDYCETSDGPIWVCSDSGIGYVQGKTFYYASGSVMYSSLEAIMQDHEGSIWIASSRNGLLQLVPHKMKDLTFAGQLGENIVNSAAEYNGMLYVGTDNKLQILDAGYRQVHNELTELLSVVRIRCMTVDSHNQLWIGEYEDYGLIRYTRSGEITSINTENSSITSNKVRVILEAASGEMVVGTSNGVNIVDGTEVVQSFGQADGLDNPVVLSLSQDKTGRIIVGTDGGGLFAIEDGRLAPFSVGDLDSGVILRTYYDAEDDALWISTNASLFHYSYATGTLQRLGYISDTVNSVYDIVEDDAGKLWLLCSDGVVTGRRDQLLGNNDVTILRQSDGLPYQTTANSWNRLDSDGNLIFCGTKGLALIDVNDHLVPEAAPKLTIEQVTADNDLLQQGAGISLNSGAKRLTFRAVVPHFSPRSAIQVEYFLENFDDTWQVQSAEGGSEIAYTNLRGGDYVFHVRARNGEGVYSEEIQIPIHKAYKPLERPGVIVLLALAGALLIVLAVFLVMHARARKILKRQQEYKMVTEQTIRTISNAIDAKDAYTEGHSERVAAYSVEIGRRLGMSEDELEQLNYIALLHDIGKIGISDLILNKPGRLDDNEFEVMRSHTSIGGDILKDLTAIQNISEGAASHHEKYDGTGYPQGLKGEDISLSSRIIGVCDSYDAMATKRSYKNPQDNEYIISELKRCSGTQFDPQVAGVMIQMLEEGNMPE